MDVIEIRPYEKKDYEVALRISYELISSILDPMVKMGYEKNVSFMKDIDEFPKDKLDGFYVSTVNNKVQGVMMLRFIEQEDVKSNGLAFFKLIRKYGFLKTIMSLAILAAFGSKLEKEELYVDYICVSKESRGKGLGSKLLNEAEKIAIRKNKPMFTLSVLSNNPDAQKLYERLGFKVRGETRFPRFVRKRLKAEKEIKMIKMLNLS